MQEAKTKEIVTRDALREMKTGETRVFELADAASIYSGMSTANQTGKILGCRFECAADYRRFFLTVKKLPLP